MHFINVLLRAKYSRGDLEKLKIYVVSRGSENDEKAIDGKNITKVQKDGFYYLNSRGEETFIPAHRIKRIEKANV